MTSNNSNVVAGSFRRGLVARTFDRISAWNERRIATQQLNTMSDRMLKDIGIDRSEIGQAVKRPAVFAELNTLHSDSSEVSRNIQRAA
jgi:uncharacterized protein YjiS (DUF1127 family)